MGKEERAVKEERFINFKKAEEKMIAVSDLAYRSWTNRNSRRPLRDYTKEEIERIIDSGSVLEQRKLSENYFYKNGFYRRTVCKNQRR